MPKKKVTRPALRCKYCGSIHVKRVNGLNAGTLGGTHLARVGNYFNAPFEVRKCEDCQSEEVFHIPK